MSSKNKRKSQPETTRVIGYVRVSTDKQADKGNSLEAQTAKLEAYAAAFGLELIAIEVDAGLSAGSLERPALQRALARMDTFEATGLLVAKLDRLTRNVRDLCKLVDTYFRDGTYRLLSVGDHIDTQTAGGRVTLNILTCISQWEREAAAERTAAVMQHLKANGKFTGGWPPFGFSADEDGNLAMDLNEQAVIAQVRVARAAGGSLRTVAASIHNPRTGKPFQPTQIVRMLSVEAVS